jgi:hypothetical protein
MSAEQRELEREFEDLLIGVLTQDHDLAVRHPEDRLERRRQGVATLQFKYHYSSADQAKVRVGIQDVGEFCCVMAVDFSSPEALQRSSEECESLALFLMEHLGAQREGLARAGAAGKIRYGRREDDLH